MSNLTSLRRFISGKKSKTVKSRRFGEFSAVGTPQNVCPRPYSINWNDATDWRATRQTNFATHWPENARGVGRFFFSSGFRNARD